MRERLQKLAPLLFLALAITELMVGAALWLSPKHGISESYLSFCNWDSKWYQSIAEEGYHSPTIPVAQDPQVSNVAFFPGYPLLARSIFLTLGLADARWPLLIVSQVSCCFFWLAFLLVLRRWKVCPEIQALAIFTVMVHPAAFYLVMGYSESLFLASMLFFFYWTDDPSTKKRWWASLAGFVMTATRIVGLPVAAYPLLRWVLVQPRVRRLNWKSSLQPLAIFVLASLGCLSFLAYCQWEYGNFQLYMLTQKIGWGIVPDYGALWKWASFKYIHPYEEAATLASGIGLAAYLLAELAWAAYSRKRPDPLRAAMYISAVLIFYITLCGLESLWFRSMIRYTLPGWLLLTLCLAHLSTRIPWNWKGGPALTGISLGLAMGALAIFGYLYEWHYLSVFLKGDWFA